jgi:hypothetical protein
VTPARPGTRAHQPTLDPEACSVRWDRAGASAYGTAAVAGFFVALEQPGPWGRNALRESHLGARLGEELETRCQERGGRFVLLRRPGSHPDTGGPVTVLVAHAGAGDADAWLLQAVLDAPSRLLDLDWEALERGDRAAVAGSLPGASEAPPALLVCTNGRRDVCCATRGRPVAAAAADVAPNRVWESSHTGGHRFAPTGVLLPWGQTYARLDDGLAAAILEESRYGRTPAAALGPLHDRGRSALPPAAQCAEAAMRSRLGEVDLGALSSAVQDEPVAEGGTQHVIDVVDVVVRHRDGRAWVVGVSRRSSGDARPESCGKAPVPVFEYHTTAVVELSRHHGLG